MVSKSYNLDRANLPVLKLDLKAIFNGEFKLPIYNGDSLWLLSQPQDLLFRCGRFATSEYYVILCGRDPDGKNSLWSVDFLPFLVFTRTLHQPFITPFLPLYYYILLLLKIKKSNK